MSTTMCEAFQATVEARRDQPALRTRGGETTLTWGEYDARVRHAAAALHRLGLRRGDTLALMLGNRPEFHVADAAAMHLGAIPFSIYNTSAPEQVEFVVEDSGARIAVVEEAFREFVDTEHVIGAEELAGLPTDELDFDASWQGVQPEDPLTLIYTSGTTGDPKGVQLSHRNMAFTIASYDAVLHLPRGGRVISYLPMAHIAERNCSHYFPMELGFTVPAAPTRARSSATSRRSGRPGSSPSRACSRSSARRSTRAPRLRDLHALGMDELQALNVGAAPCPPEVIEFFHALGLPLSEL